jgi:hypothetical protein
VSHAKTASSDEELDSLDADIFHASEGGRCFDTSYVFAHVVSRERRVERTLDEVDKRGAGFRYPSCRASKVGHLHPRTLRLLTY